MTVEDPGAPISYELLARGTPVYGEGGAAAGRLRRVVAAPAQDVFIGLVVRTHAGDRFVEAADVGALHEHAIALKISAQACRALPEPHERGHHAGADAVPSPHDLEDMAQHVWRRMIGRR